MLKELPMIAIYLIAHLFAQRYSDGFSTPIESWSTIILVFIPKGHVPLVPSLKQFRGICLLSVLGKWYSTCLVLMMEARPKPPHWRAVLAGGDNRVGVDYLVQITHLLTQRSREWWQQTPCFILDGGVWSAFVNASPPIALGRK
eukprot:2585511-Alexandrium_andersonii.AAC.1